MVQELQNTINNVPPGNLAYLQYRRLGLFDVKGGNPELPPTDHAQIVATFPLYPAITGFTSVPIWKIVPAKYQAAVLAAVNHYTNNKQVSVNSIVAQVQAQRIQSYKNPQAVYVYARQTEQGYDYIIYWNQCPHIQGDKDYTPRCSFLYQQVNVGAGQNSVYLNQNVANWHFLYETQRDPASGFARIYEDVRTLEKDEKDEKLSAFSFDDIRLNKPANATIQTSLKDSIVATAWEQTGCVNIDFLYYASPNNKLYFSACIDCLPVIVTSPAQFGLKNSDLVCECAGF
eukprot:TRINITY_DN5227_c0_g2_i2.p1 TRINITY_DN5227_c0_g2~~TRINITY_DN5227_c0_g2_i2.p1  ORF type:complete len:287 (+),score=55.29 TRINITY_DN5227_c0_g2_i2:148-1008(+)